MVLWNTCAQGQTRFSETGKVHIYNSILLGSSLGILVTERNSKGLAYSYSNSLGLITEKFYRSNNSITCGLMYSRSVVPNYQNKKYDPYRALWVDLKTQIKLDHLLIPIIWKKYISSNYVGLGGYIDFIVQSNVNQELIGHYGADWLDESLRIDHNLNNSKALSIFPRINAVPTFFLGRKLNKRFSIDYSLGFNLIKYPANNYRFNDFTIFHNSLQITYKITPK